MGGAGENDPVTRMLGGMKAFTKGLDDIKETIATTGTSYAKPQTLADQTIDRLEKIISGLRAVPVDVEIKVVPVHEGDEEVEEEPKLPVEVKSKIEQKP